MYDRVHKHKRYARIHIRLYVHPRTYLLHLLAIKSTHLNELYRDRRFSDATRANDDELVCLRIALFVTELRHFSYDRRVVKISEEYWTHIENSTAKRRKIQNRGAFTCKHVLLRSS